VHDSSSNVGYTTFQGSVKGTATHSIRQFILHFVSRSSPCAITFQLDSTALLCLQSQRQVEGGWSTPRPRRFNPGKDPVPIVQEAGWTPGPVRSFTSMPRSLNYRENSEMFWSHINCSNFVICRLNTEPPTAQHIPPVGCVHCCHLLGSFRIAPQYHSLVVLRYQLWTATC
jgi:hypothetical protein